MSCGRSSCRRPVVRRCSPPNRQLGRSPREHTCGRRQPRSRRCCWRRRQWSARADRSSTRSRAGPGSHRPSTTSCRRRASHTCAHRPLRLRQRPRTGNDDRRRRFGSSAVAELTRGVGAPTPHRRVDEHGTGVEIASGHVSDVSQAAHRRRSGRRRVPAVAQLTTATGTPAAHRGVDEMGARVVATGRDVHRGADAIDRPTARGSPMASRPRPPRRNCHPSTTRSRRRESRSRARNRQPVQRRR